MTTILALDHVWAVVAHHGRYLFLARWRAREAQRRLGGTLYRISPYDLPRIDTGRGALPAPDWSEFDSVSFVNL